MRLPVGLGGHRLLMGALRAADKSLFAVGALLFLQDHHKKLYVRTARHISRAYCSAYTWIWPCHNVHYSVFQTFESLINTRGTFVIFGAGVAGGVAVA
jgi:hypothetical protein